MKFEIHNIGTDSITLSNGSALAAGEIASFEDAVVTIGTQPETTLQHVMDKLHALEKKVAGYFENKPADPPALSAQAAPINYFGDAPAAPASAPSNYKKVGA